MMIILTIDFIIFKIFKENYFQVFLILILIRYYY